MSLKKQILCIAMFFFIYNIGFTQVTLSDSIKPYEKETLPYTLKKNEQAYNTGNGNIYIYPKPKSFSFLTRIPGDAAGMVSTTFKRSSIKPSLIIAGSTTILLFADQYIADQSKKICRDINFQTEEKNKDLVAIKIGNKQTSIIKIPQNLNTAIYQLGQGFYGLLIGAGLFTYGKLNNDYRSLSTASQLTESFIMLGVGTQLLKRITGRETPGEASVSGGKWRLFPSFSDFQNQTPKYDAFPSGHMATMIATVTILAENYPEKKWIGPVGYSISGLVGLSMINNEVHWASDYPLAIGLGYLCARQIVKKSRKKANPHMTKKSERELSYTFNYVNGKLLPGIVYKF